MQGDTYYYHIPSGHSQWEVPTSDNLSPVEAPWNPTAAAASSGDKNSTVQRVGIGLPLRCGYMDTGKLLKATMFLPAAVAFDDENGSNFYFALADGILSQYEDEASYSKKQQAMDNVLMTAFTVLEAPEVLGTGPSAQVKTVTPADSSRAITLMLTADSKSANPRLLYLRAPDNFVSFSFYLYFH